MALRYEKGARPQGLQWQEWIDRTVIRINAALDDLENNWGDTLAEVNAGSIATAVTLSYIDYRLPDLGWRDGRPRLQAFHDRFVARESMAKTVITPR